MAKACHIAKLKKKIETAEKCAEKRAELRAIVKSVDSTDEQRTAAYRKLQKLPRNANPNRIHHRCELTGRPRGYLRKFKISRIMLRKLAHEGEIPGMKKASW